MLREVWPIALLLACDVLLRRAGILFLSLVRPLNDVAVYGAAIKVIDMLGLMTTSLTGALLPHLASTWELQIKAGWRAYRYSLRYFILLSLGLTAGTFVLARPLVVLLLGASYAESMVPLQILLLSFLLNFVGGPMGALLLVSRDQLVAFVPKAMFVTTLNIVASVWLLPRFGYLAASWIAVASAAGFLLFKNGAISRLADDSIPWLTFLARPLAAALGMASA